MESVKVLVVVPILNPLEWFFSDVIDSSEVNCYIIVKTVHF